MTQITRDRLQPALLDRLTDDDPYHRVEAEERRVMTKSQLRHAVLRDLSWLFNATQPLGKESDAYARVGERAKARRALDEALRLSPSFAGAAEARKVLASLGN